MRLISVKAVTGPSLWLPDRYEEETMVMPLGDIQYGVPATDVKRLKELVEWSKDWPNLMFLGMGDYVDFASPSNRANLRVNEVSGAHYDSTVQKLQDAAERDLEGLQRILEPTIGKWIGLLDGHHFAYLSDGRTTDERLAEFLQTEFLGTSAIVEIYFESKGKRGTPAYTIFAHHGRGSAQTLGGVLNTPERMAMAFDVDAILMAHVHKKVGGKIPRIKPVFSRRGGAPRLEHKDVIIATTGSFLRGYMEEEYDGQGRPVSTYVEKAMMRPVSLGSALLWLRPRWDNDGFAQVDSSLSL